MVAILIAVLSPIEQEIGLKSLAELQRGSVLIEKNPNLCYVESIDWGRIGLSGRPNHFIQVIIIICIASIAYFTLTGSVCARHFLVCSCRRLYQENRFFVCLFARVEFEFVYKFVK